MTMKHTPDFRVEGVGCEAMKAKSPSQGQAFHIETMEREKRLELSTYTLARYRSTN
jgi:hypothetical protein